MVTLGQREASKCRERIAALGSMLVLLSNPTLCRLVRERLETDTDSG